MQCRPSGGSGLQHEHSRYWWWIYWFRVSAQRGTFSANVCVLESFFEMFFYERNIAKKMSAAVSLLH